MEKVNSILNKVIGPIEFSEEETNMLLSEREFKEFKPALQKKVKMLGINKWRKAIPRNLRILFELNDFVR